MAIVIRNDKAYDLDLPGDGLVIPAGESRTIYSITEEVAASIEAGDITVVSMEDSQVIVVEEDGQVEFDIPSHWPGPDEAVLLVNGLAQVYGEDYEVDPETGVLTWLDEEVVLEESDVLMLVGR